MIVCLDIVGVENEEQGILILLLMDQLFLINHGLTIVQEEEQHIHILMRMVLAHIMNIIRVED